MIEQRLSGESHPSYGAAAAFSTSAEAEEHSEENLAHLLLPDDGNSSTASFVDDASTPRLPISSMPRRRRRSSSSNSNNKGAANNNNNNNKNFFRNVAAVCLSWMALTVTYHFVFLTKNPSSLGASILWATPEERDLAHWYGNGDVSVSLIRQAQREADSARSVLSSSSSSSQTQAEHDAEQSNNEQAEDDESQQEPVPSEHRQRRRYLKKKALQSIKGRHHHSSSDTDDNDIPEGCESTVLLLRHCEKGSIKEHCAYEGYERSVYLASLFGNETHVRWPLPAAIFAQAPVARARHTKMNFREVETVGPLAQAAGIEVDDSYTDDRLSELGRSILQTAQQGHLCGRVVVVAWKHSRIAHLARALGCGPAQGCPVDYSGKTFDEVWQVRLVYRRWPHSSTRKFVKTAVHHHSTAAEASWKVFGSVQYEQFDPLAVSKQFGDYPPGGAAAGGHWQSLEVAYPERQRVSDTAGWRMSKVGLPRTTASAAAAPDYDDNDNDNNNRENSVNSKSGQQVENDQHDGQN